MAKLKTNYSRSKSSFKSQVIRIGLMIAIVISFIIIFYPRYQCDIRLKPHEADSQNDDIQIDTSIQGSRLFEPFVPRSELVRHAFYSLAYSEKDECALWVAYVLSKKDLQKPNVSRTDYFMDDPLVSSASANYYDYSSSGYSRGHLVPAGDMAFSEKAMTESFYMSNIAPQLRSFNGGIWRELEEVVRDWAYQSDSLYVITGPIIRGGELKIGKKNKITVPTHFYKALLDLKGKEKKSIAFIIPNERSEINIHHYSRSIDELEESLGFDLFKNLYRDQLEENSIEKELNLSKWPYSQKRYQTRINQWNHK